MRIATKPPFLLLLMLSLPGFVLAGSGTLGDPYTIAEARALSPGTTEYYAQGFIVGGWYNNFASPWTNDYSVSCADSASETLLNNCLQVKLEADGGRTNWGLGSKPENHGKKIRFKGFRDTYGTYPSFEGVNNADIAEVPGAVSNQPPTLSLNPAGTNKSVTAGNLLNFSVIATEPSGDSSDSVTLWCTNLPAGASFPVANGLSPLTNFFSWTPTGTQTGIHALAFRAGDKDGTNDTAVRVTVRSAGDGATSYYAVICGISDYEGSINDLDYCDDDAQAIYNRLIASANWSAGNIQLLKDSQATEASIHAAIQSMGASADADDICLFFFSGHGGQMDDVAPYDEADGYDEYICPYNINTTEITDDELGVWLGELPTDKLIVWLDTCFSGGNLKALGGRPKVVSRATNTVAQGDGFIADFARPGAKDVNDLTAPYISTACDDDEYSYEDPSLRHGVYTYYLLDALNAADTNANGWVSGEETFGYLYPRVVAFESTQHPQQYDAFPGQADVVRSAGGATLPNVTITNPAAPSLTVNYTNTALNLSGTCNTATVGRLAWTNSLTGATGTVAAATSWSITDIALAVGTNTVTVRGTNTTGDAASDSISIWRRPESSGNLLIEEGFDESASVPAGWTNGGTDNDTSYSHIQSAPNCRALGSGDTLETPAVNNPVEISFYVDSSANGDGQVAAIDYRIGAGAWVQLGGFIVGTDGNTETFDLTGSPDLSGSSSVSFRFRSSFYTWYLDDVVVLGAVVGDTPHVAITNPPSSTLSVPHATATYDMSGTANTNVVGLLRWTNGLTGASGSFPAAEAWAVNGIALSVGDNGITVRGTNAAGSADTAAVTITRLGEGVVETLWFQGFEGDAEDTWNFSGSGSSDAGAARTDSFGRKLTSTQAITFDSVAISGYSGVTLTVHNASTGGVENADRLEVYVALNGSSFPDTPDVWIGEASVGDNKTWSYTATGVASTVAGAPAQFYGDGVGGYATVRIAIPAGITSLSARVSAANNQSTEYYFIDDVAITGFGASDDQDNDGMPDWWEEQYGGGPTNLHPLLDDDNDGLINRDEWIAFCDPTDSNSYFAAESVGSAPTGADVVVRWNSASNRVYGVSWTLALTNGFADAATNLPATPPENAYTDTVHGAGTLGFYRIGVRLAD